MGVYKGKPKNGRFQRWGCGILYQRPSRDSNPNLRLRRPAGYPDYPTRAVIQGSPRNLKILAKTGHICRDSFIWLRLKEWYLQQVAPWLSIPIFLLRRLSL